jgi:hypothetical protein
MDIISLNYRLAQDGREDCLVNLIPTPGKIAFLGEVFVGAGR